MDIYLCMYRFVYIHVCIRVCVYMCSCSSKVISSHRNICGGLVWKLREERMACSKGEIDLVDTSREMLPLLRAEV